MYSIGKAMFGIGLAATITARAPNCSAARAVFVASTSTTDSWKAPASGPALALEAYCIAQ